MDHPKLPQVALAIARHELGPDAPAFTDHKDLARVAIKAFLAIDPVADFGEIDGRCLSWCPDDCMCNLRVLRQNPHMRRDPA